MCVCVSRGGQPKCVCVCVGGQAARGGAVGGWRGKKRTLTWTAPCLVCIQQPKLTPAGFRRTSPKWKVTRESVLQTRVAQGGRRGQRFHADKVTNGIYCPLGSEQAELEGSGGRGPVLHPSPWGMQSQRAWAMESWG